MKKPMFCLIILLWVELLPCCQCMQYLESLRVEDLDQLFSEDGCIDGSLSAMETGGPVVRPVVFEGSEHTASLKLTIEHVLDDKSPMSLINELAMFNNINLQYVLTDEEGPSHKKTFFISMKLGDEKYSAEGSSIKNAQREAARLALNSTSYAHPPTKPKADKFPKLNKTPVLKLYDWADKHGGALVSYSFIQQSSLGQSTHSHNYYHEGMYLEHENVHVNLYSKAKSIHKATVRVGDYEVSSVGPTLETAKQNAASKALQQLQRADGYCMLEDSMKSIFDKLLTYESQNQNPVSLIFEFTSKSKMPLAFDLVSEEGPAHIKRFVYKCNVGDNFETFGEGSNKKAAKKEAAEKMLYKLKSQTTYNPVKCDGQLMKSKRKSKNRKSKNLIKEVVKKYPGEEEEETTLPDEIDPISKLMHIQQKKHDILPVFNLIEERGKANKEFFIEAAIGDLTFIGSGPNKKAAKKKAAEGLLEKMGYTVSSGKIRLSSSEQKKKEFTDDSKVKHKPIAPGLNLNYNKFSKLDNDASSEKQSDKPKNNLSKSKDNTSSKLKEHTSSQPKGNIKDSSKNKDDQKNSFKVNPKTKLNNLAQEMGFLYQFSDFPKGDNEGYISLVSLTTDPPKICYGSGASTEQSQENAILTALEVLYKNQLDSVSSMLRNQVVIEDEAEQEINFIGEKTVIQPTLGKQV